MLVTQAYRFALDPTPAQERALCSHVGAARFAYNCGLALVKERLDQRRVGGEDVEVPWTLPALRREWNEAKHTVAPWWAENSKEAASSGLACLADGLRAWSESRGGKRAGRRIGFPRFKRRGRCRESFRYTTGRFGVCGRTRVQLPRVGHVRTHEPTTKLLGKIQDGRARVLSVTVSRDGGRWFCSLCCEIERCDPAPKSREAVGVDVGVRHLAVLSTGEKVSNPRALGRSLTRLRRYQRKLDRQRRAGNPDCYDPHGRAIKGKRPTNRSNRQRRTERRLTRLHARAANVRRDAIHKLTSRLAVEHATIVVERLNVAGMVRNHCLARALQDASLAELRRQFTYKTQWRGGTLIEAPTFYPSSKTCSGCGAAKAKLPLSERTYRCEHCGLSLDRDENAARNLKALAEHVAASGAETKNARSPTQVRPGPAGRRVDREAGNAPAARQTGTAFEQSEAA
jgi:putative transposase